MAELIKEKFFLDRSVGNEDVQIMLEGDIIVPDTKPDIANILQTVENIVIDRTETGADRVNYMGSLRISLLYQAKNAGVQSVELVRSIDDFANVEGVTKDAFVSVKPTISNIDYRIINDRKVSYRAVVTLSFFAEFNSPQEMVVHIPNVPANHQQKINLSVNRTVGQVFDRFLVAGQLTLPQSKPNINHVMQTTIAITNKDVRVHPGRVNISGELHVTSLYYSDGDNSRIDFAEFTLPFNGPLDVSGAGEHMLADVTLQVLDHTVTVRPDADGEDRVLDVEVSIGAQVKVYSVENISILDDAYSINQDLTFERVPIRYPTLICANSNHTTVRETATLPDGHQPMLQVCRVKGVVHVDDMRTVDDKIIVEGAISADILYVAESDDAPLANFGTLIPYRQVIEALGTAPGMRVGVDVSIEHTTFNMLSPKEVELRLQLNFDTKVISEETANIISNIEVTDTDPVVLGTQPSMRVYIMQQGDDLWKVAKRYNTPFDELLHINEIENPGKVAPGTKLLLLKNAV